VRRAESPGRRGGTNKPRQPRAKAPSARSEIGAALGAARGKSPASLARARALGVETCGRIAAFWGFTRTMGRTFGLLYLSPEPLARAEIQRRLEISVGSASMTLGALQRWGVVHRTRVKDRRAEHYRAETDFWKMISRVLDERERREITTAVELVEAARRHAGQAGATADTDGRHDAAFVSDRLARLHDICVLGQTMLDMLLGQLKLDVGRFREVLRVPTMPADPEAIPRTRGSEPFERAVSDAATKLPPIR
jgi:HTH-type transcriptional regulator, glycine betaine synthesis regulator